MTTKRSAVLRFRSSSRKVSCKLDGSRFRSCSSPMVYRDLSLGPHRLVVRASRKRARSSTAATSIALETTVLERGSGPTPGDGSVPWPPESPSPPARPGQTLVFQDDFTGTVLNTNEWRPYDSAGNGGNGLRRPSAISLDGDGHLVIDARMVDTQIVSGGMSHRRNYTYGWFEFRVRTEPDATGTMNGVVLTWPKSGRSTVDGENDMYETGSDAAGRWPFYSFVHSAGDEQFYFRHDADAAQWHTIAMDWTAGAIRIYRDGALVWTLTDATAIPDVAHHVCIQLDATATRALSQPVRMYVDWLRIYQ